MLGTTSKGSIHRKTKCNINFRFLSPISYNLIDINKFISDDKLFLHNKVKEIRI